MDPWEQYLTNRSLLNWNVQKNDNWSIARPSNNQVHSIRLALFTVMFCVLLATFSLTVGVYVGLATYSVVIRREGEAAVGKALGVAGLVCLMNVTSYILGLTFKDFIVPLEIGDGFYFLMMIPFLIHPILVVSLNSNIIILLCGISFTPLLVFITYFFSFLLGKREMRMILGAVLIPVIAAGKILEKSHSLKMSITPVPLMLIIPDDQHCRAADCFLKDGNIHKHKQHCKGGYFCGNVSSSAVGCDCRDVIICFFENR